MYPIEMPYFNTENPVVRDELWNDRYCTYGDEEEEEEIFQIEWLIDARKISEEEINELAQQIEEVSKYRVNVELFLEDDESIEFFNVYGRCNEIVYDEIIGCINKYNVTCSEA